MRSKAAIFTDKFPLVGPLAWIIAAQYFAAQIVAASAWPASYSWASDVISDLGATVCGSYNGRFVCSPDHSLINISFILLGITMALGSWLIYQEFRESQASLIGFSMMALAGLGTIPVGAFAENVSWLLDLGAILALGVGNTSLLVLALALKRVRANFRLYTPATGLVSLTAFVLFTNGIYLGLGQGTIERIASYP